MTTECGLVIKQTNCTGVVFNESFSVRKRPTGGWVIYARNGVKYGRDDKGRGLYTMDVAYPITGYRVRCYRNAWRTKREAAKAMAYLLNAGKLVRASISQLVKRRTKMRKQMPKKAVLSFLIFNRLWQQGEFVYRADMALEVQQEYEYSRGVACKITYR